jgi:hypothetical protein
LTQGLSQGEKTCFRSCFSSILFPCSNRNQIRNESKATPKWRVIEACESMMLIIVDSFCWTLKNSETRRFAVGKEKKKKCVLPWPACQRREDGLVIGRNCDTSRSSSVYFGVRGSAFSLALCLQRISAL